MYAQNSQYYYTIWMQMPKRVLLLGLFIKKKKGKKKKKMVKNTFYTTRSEREASET